MITLVKNRDYKGLALILFCLLGLVWFFVVKIDLFNKLFYQSDLFSHIQISRTWLEGRPAMHENNYGSHGKLHNYFFDLLMGPAVMAWGGFGIFIIQFVLYVWALLYTFPYVYTRSENKFNAGLFYVIVFLGPYAFWLYDDPWFGFHTEMLYIPLGFIFFISVLKKQHLIAVISSLLMVLIKEDGAVVTACLHLFYFAVLYSSNSINTGQWLKKSVLWGVFWALIFIAGIILLKYKNNFGPDRIGKAFKQIQEATSVSPLQYFLSVFKSFGLLLLPLAAFIIYLKPGKILLWWLVFLVPVIIVSLVSGFVYFPQVDFSLTWVPRFSMVFILFLALCVWVLLNGHGWPINRKAMLTTGFIVGISLFALQAVVLKNEKQYNYYSFAAGPFTKQHPEKTESYLEEIKKVSEVLPLNYPVAPPYRLFRYFHRHDYLWISAAYNAWKQPRMVICDETLWPGVNPTERLAHPDSVFTQHYRYYFEAADREYLIRAGIIK